MVSQLPKRVVPQQQLIAFVLLACAAQPMQQQEEFGIQQGQLSPLNDDAETSSMRASPPPDFVCAFEEGTAYYGGGDISQLQTADKVSEPHHVPSSAHTDDRGNT
jgi:hypothetical protein